MAIDYFNDRVQVSHHLNDEECTEVNEYLLKNPNKRLRLLWFEDVNELSFIPKLTNVKNINIEYSNLENIDFLSELTNLETLDISEMQGSLDVSAIQHLKKLKVLNLTLTKATRQTDLSVLDDNVDLKEFYFAGKFKKKSLNLNVLKNIEILAPQLSSINFSEFGELKKLKEILLFNQKITSLNGIEKLTSVEGIMLSGVRMESQDLLSPIFELPKLKILNIAYVKFIEDFTFIKQNHNLEHLFLWTLNGLQSYNGIEKLVKLKKLSHCGGHSTPNAIDFENIRELKKLKDLEIKIGKTNKETDKKINDLIKSVANNI